MSSMSIPSLQPDAQPMPVPWVRALLAKLSARYGTLFADRYACVPQDILIAEWSSELAGYTPAEIQRGLAGCRDLKFPPTLPEFLALCRPPVEPHTAYIEALQNMRLRDLGQNPEWSSPAVYWAAVEVSYFDMRSSTYSAIRARWERALSDQLARRAWPAIPRAHVALPAPPVDQRASEDVRRKLRELTERMRMK